MPIPLRADFDATSLRSLARESEDANQVRRLLALAAIYDGATRTQAAEIGGVTLQVVRDWVLKFNACAGGSSTSGNGCGRSSRSASPSRRSAASCARWDIANYRRVHVITPSRGRDRGI